MSEDQAADQRRADRQGRECPLCLVGMETRGPGPLYGVDVCEHCRTRFTNLRQTAYLVDSLIFWALLYGVGSSLFDARMSRYGLLAMIVLRALFAAKDGCGGRSPGKLICGLQVISTRGNPIGVWQSFKRNILLAVPLLNVLTIIIAALTMDRGWRLGDEWARTKVVWRRYRWRAPFAPDDQHCGICGYDLTGNLSGRCPECGREVCRRPVAEAYCPRCGYDVPENAGGWCSGCGREIARTPVLLEALGTRPPDRSRGEPA